MHRPNTLPLFPLPLVVCPGEPRLLHIFEERYQELLRHTLGKQADRAFSAFGIVFQDHEGLATIGTAVEVKQVLKQYDEGPSDILIRGLDRFAITQVHQVELYHTADVEWVEDSEPDWDENLANQAFQLHRALTKLVLGEFPADAAYSGKSSLSFAMAQSAGVNPDALQKLLELRSENERLRLLIRTFEETLPALQKAELMKKGILENWSVQKFVADNDVPDA